MREFPHHYTATAAGGPDGEVRLEGVRLPPIHSAAPAEFDGPGDRWSPETLVTAAVADCFVLTFRAIAKVSRLPWRSLSCQVTGTLDRVERVTRFTAFSMKAALRVPAGTSVEQGRRLLQRTEESCLITNSLKAPIALELDVRAEEVPKSGIGYEPGCERIIGWQ